MSSFRLQDDGYGTFKKIMSGRKQVGRVCMRGPGDYLGIIGNTYFAAKSEETAFVEVVARHLGYANAAGLRDRNAIIRRQNAAVREERTKAVNEFVTAKTIDERIEVIDSLFERMRRARGETR